jgi:hypothetical protein
MPWFLDCLRSKSPVLGPDQVRYVEVVKWLDRVNPKIGPMEVQEMIENLFIKQVAIAKHKEAPLLSEREDYLRHLPKEEKCRRSIKGTATI